MRHLFADRPRFFNFSMVQLLLAAVLFAGCGERVPVPKPRAYPRVVYPAKAYAPFDKTYCQFTFDCPTYAKVEQDTLFFGEKPRNDCWFNLRVPALSATIHCSYQPIASKKDFDELVQDAFTMAQKHNLKASYIEETPVHRPADRVHGVVFDIEGPAASSYQFYLTDSTRHFLRGALYFDTQSRPDSLAPVIDFMKKDVDRLARTLRWQR